MWTLSRTMVKLVEKSKGLRLKKEHVAPQKRPAICLAFSGVFLVLAGAMMVGLHAANQSEIALKTGGSFLIIFGIAALGGGFMYKYIVHHRMKDQRREIYVVATPSEPSRSTTPVEHIQIPLDRRRSSAFMNGGVVLGVGHKNIGYLGPQSSADPDHIPPGSARVHRKELLGIRRGSRSLETSPTQGKQKVGFKIDNDIARRQRRRASIDTSTDEDEESEVERPNSAARRPPGSPGVRPDVDSDDPDAITPCWPRTDPRDMYYLTPPCLVVESRRWKPRAVMMPTLSSLAQPPVTTKLVLWHLLVSTW